MILLLQVPSPVNEKGKFKASRRLTSWSPWSLKLALFIYPHHITACPYFTSSWGPHVIHLSLFRLTPPVKFFSFSQYDTMSSFRLSVTLMTNFFFFFFFMNHSSHATSPYAYTEEIWNCRDNSLRTFTSCSWDNEHFDFDLTFSAPYRKSSII